MPYLLRTLKRAIADPANFWTKAALAVYIYILVFWNWFRRQPSCGSVLVFPQPLRWPYVLTKVLKVLGMQQVPRFRSDCRVAIFWIDSTFRKAPRGVQQETIKTLNANCTDISKSNIAVHFERTFAYPMAIDPLRHIGGCVCKSDENATHNGRVVECPIADTDPGFVYHRLIDNRDGDMVVDFRTPICGSAVPFVYVKRRPIKTRFSNKNSKSELSRVENVYSKEEVAKLLAFARSIGADLAELDVLRDRNSGKIYVVDVNVTPHGPPNALSLGESIRAVHLLAEAFENEFLAVSWEGQQTPLQIPCEELA